MSEQFENMLHSLCFAYADESTASYEKYDTVYAKLVERDRALLEAIRLAKTELGYALCKLAVERLESVLKELGEDV